MKYAILDYETRSRIDLKKVGAYEYAKHPSTQVLCVSWRVGTKKELREELNKKIRPKIWSPAFPKLSDNIQELIDIINDTSIRKVAHNAFFEQVITLFVLSRHKFGASLLTEPKPWDWECTAASAAALALPRNLEGACLALELPIQKDMEGRRLILKYCKPRKPTKNNPSEWHESATDLKRIMHYCQNDVDAETMLFLSIVPLIPDERDTWILDQMINFRGFEVDRDLVKTSLRLIAEETKVLNHETAELSNGELATTNQRAKVIQWLKGEGLYLPDLTKKTVDDAIKSGLAKGRAKRMLEIRQAVSKTSTAKYQAFEIRSRSDGRVRDNLVFHGASTGRWSGAGVQPQNFPRGTIEDAVEAALEIKRGSLDWLRCLYDNPMDVFSSCLRPVIQAPKGCELFCADYAAIEARVLFWVAEHDEGLAAFAENRPMYEEMACEIYREDLETFLQLVKDKDATAKNKRQVGKQTILGCGYGMGWRKFIETCRNYGIEIDEATAQLAVKTYRDTHSPVPQLWYNLENTAIKAVKSWLDGKPKRYKINRTIWFVEDDYLKCELPSGRRLSYYKPSIKYEMTPWNEKRPKLYHFSVNPMTRQWESASTYGGKLTENVVQAISRDFMAEAMKRIDGALYTVILSVHDEIVAQRTKGTGTLDDFENLMAELPLWGAGCPIRVEGWVGEKYHK